MSKTTTLASGQITPTDTLLVELHATVTGRALAMTRPST